MYFKHIMFLILLQTKSLKSKRDDFIAPVFGCLSHNFKSNIAKSKKDTLKIDLTGIKDQVKKDIK